MKKILVAIATIAVLFMGCQGNKVIVPQAGDILAKSVDVAFYLVLKNNPQYKAETVLVLKEIRAYANGEGISYNDLLVFANEKFQNEDLVVIALIIGDGLFTEEPFINSIGMFDGYKEELIKRINRFLFVAELVKPEV